MKKIDKNLLNLSLDNLHHNSLQKKIDSPKKILHNPNIGIGTINHDINNLIRAFRKDI